MEVRVHIPRPLLTITIVAVGLLWWNGILTFRLPGGQIPADAAGGNRASSVVVQAGKDIDRERTKQAVLAKREEILRYQLSILEDQALTQTSPENVQKLNETRAVLLSIIKQRSQSEKLLQLSLEQLWEAEGTAYSMTPVVGAGELDWPVYPALGVSAHFEDDGYKARFGIDHHAIDIPVNQGTPIRAPADGKVVQVALNGLGYSYIVLEHANKIQTIYGHISESKVNEGDLVTFGQVIGKTGGQPGSPGAGLLTTGPHLHFAVKSDGVLVDPMQFLPEIPHK